MERKSSPKKRIPNYGICDMERMKGSNKIHEPMKDRKLIKQQHCASLLDNEVIMHKIKDVADMLLCDLPNHCCFILPHILNASRVDISLWGLMPIAMYRT